MATYHLEYRQWSHRLEAPSKAQALKQWYADLVPSLGPEGVTFKAFTQGCVVVREKVVKVETWVCPVDGHRDTRKGFISHVRAEHIKLS